MNIAAAVALGLAIVSASPKPDEHTVIDDNQISMTFNQPVADFKVIVTDSKGCIISQSVALNGTHQLVVRMKACERIGYPGGHMVVKYTVNGVDGEYHLHIHQH